MGWVMKIFNHEPHEPTRTAARYERKVRDVRGIIILIRGEKK